MWERNIIWFSCRAIWLHRESFGLLSSHHQEQRTRWAPEGTPHQCWERWQGRLCLWGLLSCCPSHCALLGGSTQSRKTTFIKTSIFSPLYCPSKKFFCSRHVSGLILVLMLQFVGPFQQNCWGILFWFWFFKGKYIAANKNNSKKQSIIFFKHFDN